MPTTPRASSYVSGPVEFLGPDGQRAGEWSPITSTLVCGAREAILIDTAITQTQNIELGDWIERILTTQRLSFIYITHGHADHWLGIGYLMKRWPGAKAIASAGTIEHMRQQIEPDLWKSTYGTRFPGQIDEDFVLAEPLPANGEFFLDGNILLKAVEVGHSDTHDSTILWVPSIKLAICGDVVYGGVHQQLRYANTSSRREEWVRAIEKVEELGPMMVVPGHKKPSELDGAYHLQASKEYIQTFGEMLNGARGPEEFFDLMKEKYPARLNPLVLWGSCVAAFAVPYGTE